MKFAMRIGLTLAIAMIGSSVVRADSTTITFDEFAATNNNSPLTTAYTSLGVVFDANNSGTWGGIANGDPGNWGVNGTNGPQFLGNNGLNNGNTFTESIIFSTPESSVSLDASRTNGSSAGQTLTLEAFDISNNLLASTTVTLGDINNWTNLVVTGSDISSVELIGSVNGFSPYAIDNLQFTSVPEPGSLVLLGTGLMGLLGVARRKLR